MFLCLLIQWPFIDIQVKFYGDRPGVTLPSGGGKGVNATGIAEYSDFRLIEDYISETVRDRR